MADYLNFETTSDGVEIREPETDNLVARITYVFDHPRPWAFRPFGKFDLPGELPRNYRSLEAAKYRALSEYLDVAEG